VFKDTDARAGTEIAAAKARIAELESTAKSQAAEAKVNSRNGSGQACECAEEKE